MSSDGGLPGDFHPATRAWFAATYADPTEAQRAAWPAWRGGHDALVAAPTGSGKTLAAFLAAIDALVHEAATGALAPGLRVLYVSPLKALGNDVERNLRAPLAGISAILREQSGDVPEIRAAVRSGDTKSAERARMLRSPPQILVTTPESLYLLLTSERGREALRTVQTVIVDEIHAIAGDRRGSHLALSLARLDALCGQPPRRIGLSATVRPLNEVARLLIGNDPARLDACVLADVPARRALDGALVVPGSPLEAVLSAETRTEIVEAIAALCLRHQQTLVFVSTRRMAERFAAEIAAKLSDVFGDGLEGKGGHDRFVATHHGSLSRATRHRVEAGLRDGSVAVCVATASLELGIDIGAIDLVVQIGSPRSAAVLVQRAGRAGHRVGGTPKVRVFPTTRDDLVECAALLAAVQGALPLPDGVPALEATRLEDAPLDVLAQQIVAECAAEPWHEDALYAMVRRAAPYRDLPRARFDDVMAMLGEGVAARRGRRMAWLHRDRVGHIARGRKGARLAALTSGGAIPDAAAYDVVLHGSEQRVGSLHEDFAIESTPGDVFLLGTAPWRIIKVESNRVRVEPAPGMMPSLPFWVGEAPSRSDVASAAVRALRAEVGARLEAGGHAEAVRYLRDTLGLLADAAEQIATFLHLGRACLGALPGDDALVLERFFDRSGGMQLVLHSPYGGRVNRAFGLALRKRFCRRFNFELQAAATDDAVLLSLGETHAFPLDEVWSYLHSASVRDVLVQAVLASPLFTTRWRWVAGRALGVLRWRGGRRVPPNFQRIDAEDLVSVLFPDQLACAENLAGAREVPDHPLVQAALTDTLHEAMDLDGLTALLGRLERGTLRRIDVDAREPSPLAMGMVHSPVYTFLDDAPLEERRAATVASRRWLRADEDVAALGHLDPAAIARVRDEIAPSFEDAPSLHDALDVCGWLSLADCAPERGMLDALITSGRATTWARAGGTLVICAERQALATAALARPPDADALRELLRARLGCEGPTRADLLAGQLDVDAGDVAFALRALEAEGFVLRGAFDRTLPPPRGAGAGGADAHVQWCERRVLGRIHRATLDGLRRSVTAVSPAAYVRFLTRWQGVEGPRVACTPATLERVLARLWGWQAPLATWEDELLPRRIDHYDPMALDGLMLAGRLAWLRLDVPAARGGSGPARNTPIALVPRVDLPIWLRLSRCHRRTLSANATAVSALLADGPAFVDDLAAALRLPSAAVQDALGELVAAGRARSDALGGLRAMLRPRNAGRSASLGDVGGRGGRRSHRGAASAIDLAGRWSLLTRASDDDADGDVTVGASAVARAYAEDDVMHFARVLLARWGVIYRRVLEREPLAPPWRLLLRALWRLEARGEVRGGRFVSGPSGEQFALPEAVAALRANRDGDDDAAALIVAAADPLNVSGWLLDGPKVSPAGRHRVALRDGAVVAAQHAGEVWYAGAPEPAERWTLSVALERGGRLRS